VIVREKIDVQAGMRFRDRQKRFFDVMSPTVWQAHNTRHHAFGYLDRRTHGSYSTADAGGAVIPDTQTPGINRRDLERASFGSLHQSGWLCKVEL
jgi:hypothetical protein